MNFKTDKSAQHLRARSQEAGLDERMHAIQSLGHQYGTGSRAMLAELLLSALGGGLTHSDAVLTEHGDQAQEVKQLALQMGEVAESMQCAANDLVYENKEAG